MVSDDLQQRRTAAAAGLTYPWLYENKFATEHPEVLTVDRQGNKQYMVWEYAYPEARRAKVSEFVQFARDYGFQRFVACLRTEAAQNQPAPRHADQFGFNAPVVAEMKTRYGVDILTDRRFDDRHPQFDVHDPMLENWRKLRGDFLTQFYRELRAALNEIDPTIQIAVQIPGDRVGTCLGNWHLDWRTWIDEGLVNEIVVPVVLDDYVGYGPQAKPADFGYLDASVSAETVRAFVQQSRQPTARVIRAGGPATSPDVPSDGDGWRLDAWPDLWTFNSAERWEQWRRDFAEFGHIKFIEQSFDDFPENSDGYGGGYGDFCHRPDLRSCPGYWEVLGDGSNSRPYAQRTIRRGASGRAMKLTRSADGSANLSVRHHSRHDRSNYPFPGDTAISSGACQLRFWIYRENAKAGFVAYLQDDIDTQHANEIGLYLPPGESSPLLFREGGHFAASSVPLPVGQWSCVTIDVNLERSRYSMFVASGGHAEQPVCRDVKYESEHNAFNKVDFSPQGETGSVFYLDDVSLQWHPAMMFESPGAEVLARDGFEPPNLGQHWSLDTAGATDSAEISVDTDLSFGPEYGSLRFRGAAGRATLTRSSLLWTSVRPLLIDLDVFLKSDQYHTQITPSPRTTGTDDVGLALYISDRAKPMIELRTTGSFWHCGSGGKLLDTRRPVAFDTWHHLQIAIDPRSRDYHVLFQVLGEPPRQLCRGVVDQLPSRDAALSLELSCLRARPRADGPAFDNLLISR